MDEPQPDPPNCVADGETFDRSQQAARFLDLTRQHGLVDDDDDDVLSPLVETRLQGIIEAQRFQVVAVPDPTYGLGDPHGDKPDNADDIRIDPTAFCAMRPGSVTPGTGLGGFSLDDDDDDDDDVFGDGNGFGSGTGFGPSSD